MIIQLLLILWIVALALICLALCSPKTRARMLRSLWPPAWAGPTAANIAEGTHPGGLISRLTDAAFTTRYLLVKTGADADHVTVNGGNDDPLGVLEDEAAAAEDWCDVAHLGSAGRTLRMVASEPVDAGVRVYTAAGGKVSDLSATPGTYYLVGRALSAAGADGDSIEVDPCFPVATVVSGG